LPSIAVDAGPLIALFRKSDRHHDAARAFLERHETGDLITNMLIVGEVAAMLGHRRKDLASCLGWILENIEVDSSAHLDLPRAIEIVEKYNNVPADLADASLVALCERRGIDLVASADRDFDIYRLPKSKKFRNVFLTAG